MNSLKNFIFKDLVFENEVQNPEKGVRPMFNLTDFEKKMIKGLFKKEKPEIIRRVARQLV